MIKSNYANAMAEVLEYLKGIRDEDIKKIPKEFMNYLKENSSKQYKPNFDYTKPLKELKLMDETKGIICFICHNYWFENQTDKDNFLSKLNENEKKFQQELKEKYNNEINKKNPTENSKNIEAEPKESLPVKNEIKNKSKILMLLEKIFSIFKGSKNS